MTLPAHLQGIVTAFKGDGRRLGYPTANIVAATILPDGIYFGFSTLDTYIHHLSLIFIGTPSTLAQDQRRVEAHILDIPDKDYYGQQLSVEAHTFHRVSQTYNSIQELLAAIQHDERAARAWFAQTIP